MELTKDIVKQFYNFLILMSCVFFVLWIFFSAEIFGVEGILEGAGKIYEPMVESEELKNKGLEFIECIESGYIPVAKYTGGVQRASGQVCFKDLFSVRKENGSFVSGSAEDEFALYLVDIKTYSGNSVLEILSTEEIKDLEEIPAAFVYDKEKDILYFHGSGIYVGYIKVYGQGGAQSAYEFQLPVEVS